eukprot:488070_1
MSSSTEDVHKEIIGLSFIPMNQMHNMLLSEINIIRRESKSKRYEFLVANYPDEDTEKGFMKHRWQEDHREQLLAKQKVKLIIRAGLYIKSTINTNKRKIPFDLLQNAVLQINIKTEEDV